MNRKLTFIDIFAGIGGFRSGMEQAGHKCVGWIEWDKFARQSYQAMYNTEGEYNAKDIQQVKGSDLPDSDVWCFGFPCFVDGTLVATRDGIKPIEQITVGDEVVTIDGSYQPVVKTMVHKSNNIYNLKVEGNLPLEVTGNHPIYTRKREDIYHHSYIEHKYSDPKWIKVSELSKGDLVMNYSPKGVHHRISNNLAWLLGRYLADGYIYDIHRNGRENSYWHNTVFCIGSDKADEFRSHLGNYHVNESNTSNKNGSVIKFSIYDKELVSLCNTFGRGALNKEVAPWVFNLSKEERKKFIDGYVSGDGSRSNNPYQSVSTVSPKLALSFSKLIENTLGVSSSVFKTIPPKTKLFQGKRLIHQHPLYTVRYRKTKSKRQHSRVIDNNFWKPIKEVKPIENAKYVNVYNMEVKNNHTYNANGIIVHNCQDVSNAGKKAGLLNGKRSGMFFEVVRLLQERIKHSQTLPAYLFVENVKNLLSIDGGWGFARMQIELDKAGYDTEWSVINSAEVVPQNRERLYIIGHFRASRTSKVFPIFYQNNTSNSKSYSRIHQLGNLIPDGSFNGNPQVGRVYGIDGVSPTLNTMQGGGRVPKIYYDKRIRTLTPLETWRLQGFTDEQFDKAKDTGLSNSQLYKQIGNSATVPVIKVIAEKLS